MDYREETQPTGVSTSWRKIGKSFHLCHPKENYFLKSLPSNPDNYRDKTADTHARQTKTEQINDSKSTEIQRLDNDGKGVAWTASTQKVAVQWSNLPAGRQVKLCAFIKVYAWLTVKLRNRHLRKSENHYLQAEKQLWQKRNIEFRFKSSVYQHPLSLCNQYHTIELIICLLLLNDYDNCIFKKECTHYFGVNNWSHCWFFLLATNRLQQW